MPLTFGTDGVRGLANVELTPERVLALGRVAARVLGNGTSFLVGRDTRASGSLLAAALAAGLAAEGVDVTDLGVLPTPGVAALAAERGQPAAMISASHNPAPDNGVKFFAPGGRKLPVEAERELEIRLAATVTGPLPADPPVTGGLVGRITVERDAADRYRRWLLASLGGRQLNGVRVVLDCANGAASAIAPAVMADAGADVVAVLASQPDGVNINEQCGSTYPARLQAAVAEHGRAVGLAFDGDADRVIAVDEQGRVVDGDQLLAMFAADLRAQERLSGDTLVVTVMANLGLRLAMADLGIRVEETPVGDRHVLEALDRGGWSLGGEQSGHIIFRDLATTGDGILTGLQLLDFLARHERPLSELAAVAMQRLPQVLRNVPVADPRGLDAAEEVWAHVRTVEAALGGRGRVLLRPSGTEPVVRVMVEAPTETLAADSANRLAVVVAEALGAG